MECLNEGQDEQFALDAEAIRRRFHRFVRPSKVGIRLAKDCWPRTARGMRNILKPGVYPRYEKMLGIFARWLQKNPLELSAEYGVSWLYRGMNPSKIKTLNENERMANEKYDEQLESYYRELKEDAEIGASIEKELSLQIDEAQDEVERAFNEWGDNQ
jgi:hypothetical protein